MAFNVTSVSWNCEGACGCRFVPLLGCTPALSLPFTLSDCYVRSGKASLQHRELVVE